jgi:hypothetical protein
MEIWKSIKGYEGIYEISNYGRVSSLPRKYLPKGKILDYGVNNIGYPRVNLCKNGKVKPYLVHRIIAKAFIPNPNNKPQINHINGIKTDNRLENLEWTTQSENVIHAYKIGLCTNKGETHYLSKLTENDVLQIRKLKGSMLQKDIAKKYNVKISCISSILNYRTWKHI